MQDLDAIEAINIDQLVTATDRILLRGPSRRRPSRPAIDFTHEATAALAASRAREACEQTVYVRAAPGTTPLVGAAAMLAIAWLAVTFACLLA